MYIVCYKVASIYEFTHYFPVIANYPAKYQQIRVNETEKDH